MPEKNGRIWYEADINYSRGFRNGMRIVFSDDGLVFVTYDHYQTFYEIIKGGYMENKLIEIDFSNCKYIGSVHKEIKEKLELPEWYGENLDALWDALIGIAQTPIIVKIIFKPQTISSKKLTPYINEVINVFNEAVEKCNEINVIIER